MEILALYLKDYKNFENSFICLSSRFKYTFDPENEIVAIENNLNYIDNFFENPNITNVTAIIGQNGTGKSNLFEFIRSLAPSNGGFSAECGVFLKYNDRFEGETHRYYFTANCKLNLQNSSSFKFTEKQIESSKNDRIFQRFTIDDLAQAIVVNYSNVVDLKVPTSHIRLKLESEEEQTSTDDFHNISTMSMLSSDQQNFSTQLNFQIEKLDAYKSREIGRNIEFIVNGPKEILDFVTPEDLFVIPLNNDEVYFKNTPSEYAWLLEIIDRYDAEFKNPENELRGFHVHFIRSAFFNFMLWQTEIPEHYKSEIKRNFLIIDEQTLEGLVRKFLNRIISLSQKDTNWEYISIRASYYLNLIDFNYEYSIKFGYQNPVVFYEEKAIRIPVNTESKYRVDEFINLYIRAKGKDDFLNFKWRSLSSGEQSMLTLLSRFYQLSLDIKTGTTLKPFIVLLDEPDLYFHPEWQRKLLNQLIKYIPSFFPDATIQFIITANTPYLVSDLPPSNVVMLRKKDGKLVAGTADNFGKRTFAANIHTLLSEDFFVSNFIAEFAKMKIEKLIKYIEEPEGEMKTIFNQESAFRCIEYIGEPVIKNRLMDLYRAKFSSIESLQLQKNRLEIELEAINRKLNPGS